MTRRREPAPRAASTAPARGVAVDQAPQRSAIAGVERARTHRATLPPGRQSGAARRPPRRPGRPARQLAPTAPAGRPSSPDGSRTRSFCARLSRSWRTYGDCPPPRRTRLIDLRGAIEKDRRSARRPRAPRRARPGRCRSGRWRHPARRRLLPRPARGTRRRSHAGSGRAASPLAPRAAPAPAPDPHPGWVNHCPSASRRAGSA